MRHALLAAGFLASLTATVTTQQSARQGSPYYTAEQLAAIQQMPTVDESNRVKPEEIDALLAGGDVLLLDVREPKEIEDLGTLEGAVNIPILQLENRLGELPKDRAILTA